MIFQPTLKKSTIENFLKELKGGIQDHLKNWIVQP